MAGGKRGIGADRRVSLVVGLMLVAALAVLVTLQARWLGELATAQGEQTRRTLQVAAGRMAVEFQVALAEIQDAVLASAPNTDASTMALVLEVVPLEPGEEPILDAPSFAVHDRGGARWLVVLDTRALEVELFPALARAALGIDGLETYRVAVVATEGDAPALYDSHPDGTTPVNTPDVSEDLHLLPTTWIESLGDPGATWIGSSAPVFITDGDPGQAQLIGQPANWRIELRHRAGSLEVALAQARGRNFMLAGGVLTLLLAGLGFLWVSEQRARRLAETELAFVAGVSHELRTPLAVVRTAASNLARGVVHAPAHVVEYGELIERETTRVAALVERVLRFSDDETALVMDDVNVADLIAAAVERCEPWRDRRRYEVVVDVEAGIDSVRADGAALISALHNLVENAIKYGQDGMLVRVRATRAAGLTIEVADDGPGISAGDRALLFDAFYRGSAVRDGNIPGNGLGLGVAREIAQAHGGQLELLASKPGVGGATFALSLPEDGGHA